MSSLSSSSSTVCPSSIRDAILCNRALAETFEGLGLGSWLAFIKLLTRYNYVPVLAAVIYGLSTPVDIAVGLALRSSHNPGSATASVACLTR
jgi:hypothetical protein